MQENGQKVIVVINSVSSSIINSLNFKNKLIYNDVR